MAYNKEELLQLSVEENICLVADLWDSIDEKPSAYTMDKY